MAVKYIRIKLQGLYMAHKCMRCNKAFKYNWELERHKGRKFPCKEATEQRCKWCLKLFKSAKNLKRHECKWKEDEIRCLEVELGVEIEPIYESKKCRYCKKVYSQTRVVYDHMKTCKKKAGYLEELRRKQRRVEEKGERERMLSVVEEKEESERMLSVVEEKGERERVMSVVDEEKEESERVMSVVDEEKEESERVLSVVEEKDEQVESKEKQTINANNVQIGDHNTQINITLNAFGKENIDYIDKKQVVKLVERFLTYSRNIDGFCAALTKLMHGSKAHPENHSVLMHGEKKAMATVYNGKTFEERKAVDVTQRIIETGADHVCAVYEENKSEMMNMMSKSKMEMVEDLANDPERKRIGRCRSAVKEALCVKETKDMVKKTMKECGKGSHTSSLCDRS